MAVTVRFFASLREQIGTDNVCCDYTLGVTVAQLWKQAAGDFQMPSNTLCAVNMDYARPDTVIKDGDEVAFFPPVTGG